MLASGVEMMLPNYVDAVGDEALSLLDDVSGDISRIVDGLGLRRCILTC